jgi:hypothetical protein
MNRRWRLRSGDTWDTKEEKWKAKGVLACTTGFTGVYHYSIWYARLVWRSQKPEEALQVPLAERLS